MSGAYKHLQCVRVFVIPMCAKFERSSCASYLQLISISSTRKTRIFVSAIEARNAVRFRAQQKAFDPIFTINNAEDGEKERQDSVSGQ